MLPELGVNSVRTNHNVTFGDSSVCERHARYVTKPLKAGAPVPGVHHVGRQGFRQHVHKVCAMHAVCRIPAR
jgi:hypothetical protein